MARGDRLRALREGIRTRISEGLENLGGTVLVSIKKKIIEFGCGHLEDAIAFAHKGWMTLINQYAAMLPGDMETRIGEAIWVRIEKTARAFAATVCTPPAVVAGAPAAPGEEVFGSSEQLVADDEVLGMAADPTLLE